MIRPKHGLKKTFKPIEVPQRFLKEKNRNNKWERERESEVTEKLFVGKKTYKDLKEFQVQSKNYAKLSRLVNGLNCWYKDSIYHRLNNKSWRRQRISSFLFHYNKANNTIYKSKTPHSYNIAEALRKCKVPIHIQLSLHTERKSWLGSGYLNWY